MATSSISGNISITSRPRTPSVTELDGDESFVILGRSPSSFMFNEEGNQILQDALESLNIKDDVARDSPSKEPTAESAKVIQNGDVASSVEKILDSFPKNANVQVKQSENESVEGISFSELTNEEIQAKIDLIINENIQLKDTIKQNQMTMKKQCETILQWQEDVQKVHSTHKEQFAQTKKFIKELQVENAQLKDALKSTEKQSEEKINKTVQSSSEFYQLQAVEMKNQDLELALQRLLQEKQALQEQLNMEKQTMQNKIEILQSQLDAFIIQKNTLEFELAAEKAAKEKIQKELAKEKQTRIGMESNNERLSQSNTEFVENMRQQLMNAQMHITNLELGRTEDREVINEKEQQLADLKEQLAKLTIESDVLAAMKTQLELYKADYDSVFTIKNQMMMEMNQQTEDLMNLQRRNQQLLEEVERLRTNDFVHVERISRQQPSAPSAQEHACPKCNFKFTNYNALENHVYRCIELDSLP